MRSTSDETNLLKYNFGAKSKICNANATANLYKQIRVAPIRVPNLNLGYFFLSCVIALKFDICHLPLFRLTSPSVRSSNQQTMDGAGNSLNGCLNGQINKIKIYRHVK